MGLWESVQTCFSKYAVFRGTASRSEYWYFILFGVLTSLVVTTADLRLGTHIPASLISLAMFLPSTAVLVRRLHDTEHSGWWYLIAFTGVGGLVLLYWACRSGTTYDNKYSGTRNFGRSGFA